MQFHHHGYVSGDPRVAPASDLAASGVERGDLPDEVDVLVVGTGPAGMIAAAQLAQFPDITTRIVDRRAGRLEIGQADGIQARSVETFQAFGFAGSIAEEAFRITEMAFWKPDPADPSRIRRAALTPDDATGISEFPHLIVNQARVLDHFAEAMARSPSRLVPSYGWDLQRLVVHPTGHHPVEVELRWSGAPDAAPGGATLRTVRAAYVVGADGARSGVREAIGARFEGAQARHAWGVMDLLAVTDFPDIRRKCAIQSGSGGSILHIPREGGHLFRMYVDLGEVADDDAGAVRSTSLERIVGKAREILSPYVLDVRDVPWYSVYEVGHRLTDRFDDVPTAEAGARAPRVFIAGDACHTHSAKAGQGMNVSMQDGWNIAWKLAHVLQGRSHESLLATYSQERQVVARDLIEFDRQWSSLMARRPEEVEDSSELEDFYVRTMEFPAGFATRYGPSMVTGGTHKQVRAAGFPIGKRFRSATVIRVCDGNPVHLGHHAKADGRWRLYVFGDAALPAEPGPVQDLASWLTLGEGSPLAATPPGQDADAWFDVKVVYQQPHNEFSVPDAPALFRPVTGPFALVDHEKVYAADPGDDVFERRQVDRGGAVVVVRPDQYVAHVLPLSAHEELAAFFRGIRGGAAA